MKVKYMTGESLRRLFNVEELPRRTAVVAGKREKFLVQPVPHYLLSPKERKQGGLFIVRPLAS